MSKKNEYTGELLLYPCPTILVTSLYEDCEDILAVSWAGIASSHPEYITIAINKKRYSYNIIRKSQKFCANIPNIDIIQKVDYCGSVSGRDTDKFAACGFRKEYYHSEYISIAQCPISIFCEVESIVQLGSHDLFIGKVVLKLINNNITDLHLDLDPIVYFRPNYYGIEKKELGFYGYSIE